MIYGSGFLDNMAANVRRAVNAVTDFVFPVPKQNNEQQELYMLKANSKCMFYGAVVV